MDKNLNEIRKKIAERKSEKWNTTLKKNHIVSVNDEERYGNLSTDQSTKLRDERNSKWFPKLLWSTFAFFFVFFIYNAPQSITERVEPAISHVLTEDLPFATVQSWYEAHFGGTLVSLGFDRPENPPADQMPVSVPVSDVNDMRVVESDEGILIQVDSTQSVYPIERGTVLFAGTKSDTGRTIILQHPDGTKSTYGHLSDINVFHYQSIPADQVIGTVEPDEVLGFSNLYLSIQEGREYLNPVDYIFGDLDE